MNEDKLKELLDQYLTGTISMEGKTELLQLIENTEERGRLDLLMQETFSSDVFAGEDDPRLRTEIQDWLKQKIRESEAAKIVELSPVEKKPPVRKLVWLRYAAAVVILIVAGYVFWITSGKSGTGSPKTEVAKVNDVPAPKETRAVITLANGSKVYLDSVENGTIAQENNVAVVKNNEGSIIYSTDHQITESPDHQIAYNTLFNPRGSKVISLTLSDGTKVWLNSESSLKYPTAFTTNTREVEITGEAYFEVKHNAKEPFKVHLPNGSVVEDIGTSFNVNAYSDESDIKTTLIEGSVRVVGNTSTRGPAGRDPMETTNKGVVLKPGEQAIDKPNSPLITHHSPDLEKILAWKNNEFNFHEDDIQTIMRQLARWYNIRPVITGTPSTNYTGRITRDVPLSKVLDMFEKLGYVDFEINGDEVKVINK